MYMAKQKPELKEKILEMREQGFSYNEICGKLNVSKGTVSYHCGKGVKEKQYARQMKPREDWMWKRAIIDWELHRDKDWFRKGQPTRKKALSELKGVINDVYDNKCYLTGRELDMENGTNVVFDHKIPKSAGGSNTLENLGLCVKDANQAKSDLTLDELFELCKDILEHNGYEVNKK